MESTHLAATPQVALKATSISGTRPWTGATPSSRTRRRLAAFPHTSGRAYPHLGGTLFALRPEDAWFGQLAGKRVLVVHQQSDLLVKRWRNETLRRLIWPGKPHGLPDFKSLVGYIPVDGADAKRPFEPDWRAAFDHMARGLNALSQGPAAAPITI